MINSVKKAMDIFTILSVNPEQSMTLSELAEKAGINKSTCAHILDTMCDAFYVERVSRKEGYRLGPWAYMLSRYGGYHNSLKKVASPVLKWLNVQSGATVFISVVCNGRKYIIYHIDKAGILPQSDGSIIQGIMETTASGRLLMAHMDMSSLHYALSKSCVEPRPVITPELLNDLKYIRTKGYSHMDVTEHSTQSYAFPVSSDGKTIAAIGILYKNEMDSPEYRKTVVGLGKTAAEEISRRIAFQ